MGIIKRSQFYRKTIYIYKPKCVVRLQNIENLNKDLETLAFLSTLQESPLLFPLCFSI